MWTQVTLGQVLVIFVASVVGHIIGDLLVDFLRGIR